MKVCNVICPVFVPFQSKRRVNRGQRRINFSPQKARTQAVGQYSQLHRSYVNDCPQNQNMLIGMRDFCWHAILRNIIYNDSGTDININQTTTRTA